MAPAVAEKAPEPNSSNLTTPSTAPSAETKKAVLSPAQAGWSVDDIKREYPVDPTFTYFPSRPQWVERQIKNAPKARGVPLPEGFPTAIEGPSVWDGFEVQNNPEKWLYTLTESDNAELRSAFTHWKSLDLPLSKLNRTTFPLSDELKARTEVWVDQLLNGLGFFQIRGFDIDNYTDEEATIIYAGLASYIGDKRLNQVRGVLAHIRADPSFKPEDIAAPAQETVFQVYHTDAIPGGNIASFLVLHGAASGGDSQLASVGKVYNDIAKTRPDVIATLASKWTLDIGNYLHGTPGNHVERPLLYYDNGRIVAAIARRSVTGYGIWGRHKSLPKVTEEQKEALDTLHFLGAKHGVNIPIRRGDIQFLNNYEVFHAREEYKDSEETQRHLVRLWLSTERIQWEKSDSGHLKGEGKTRFEKEDDAEETWNFDPRSFLQGSSSGKKDEY
ncbi:hypothetical protein DFJ73DRAFT_903250 [Zopfochytrium polystomum]|nr:hypothetical protein DFJ73DRAFT_903250 [Zopfochytrium polystomum]